MPQRDIQIRLDKALSECNTSLDDITYDRNPYVTTPEQKDHARMGALISFHNAMVQLLGDIRDSDNAGC